MLKDGMIYRIKTIYNNIIFAITDDKEAKYIECKADTSINAAVNSSK